VVNEDGLACRKHLFVGRDGVEHDFHSGGHTFASDEVWARLTSWHYDAGMLLAGRAAAAHPPAECPGPAECVVAWLDAPAGLPRPGPNPNIPVPGAQPPGTQLPCT